MAWLGTRHLQLIFGMVYTLALGPCWLSGSALASVEDPPPSELVFPLHPQHNHAPGIAELHDGSLIVSWYRGSGERKADDVAVYGARLAPGERAWSEPFLLADNPGFPDGNTALHVDDKGRLWLFWPVVIANTWESCLTQYRVSDVPVGQGAPTWSWQGSLFLRPLDFEPVMSEALDARLRDTSKPPEDVPPERLEAFRERIRDKLSQRLGWQPRAKPTVIPSGRILLPLYSDTYSVSIVAISDDDGKTWAASRPLAGFGNIQPTILCKKDGALVAYMRENGPLNRIRISESRDGGWTWGPVGVTALPNPGAGIDGLVLRSGEWILVYNDSESGRSRLAISLSTDEGATWGSTRPLERAASGSYHYPAVIQGRDGRIHVVYSYFVEGGKSLKHVTFSPDWIRGGP